MHKVGQGQNMFPRGIVKEEYLVITKTPIQIYWKFYNQKRKIFRAQLFKANDVVS